MLVALSEVTLRDGHFAVGTIPKLDARIAASKVGANQLLAMLDVFRDDKVCRLRGEKVRENQLSETEAMGGQSKNVLKLTLKL